MGLMRRLKCGWRKPQKRGVFRPFGGAFLLFRSGPASRRSIGSHERARAGAARETAGTVPTQTSHRSAGPRGAIWADRPEPQLTRNPAAADKISRPKSARPPQTGAGSPLLSFLRLAPGYDIAISRRGWRPKLCTDDAAPTFVTKADAPLAGQDGGSLL